MGTDDLRVADILIDEVFGDFADDPIIRQRARELLHRNRTYAGMSPVPSDAGADADAVERAMSALTGRVGRYTFLDRLGRGGMGLVMRVHDHRLNRDVAMKVLRPDRKGRRGMQGRFIEEAQTTAQLEHPGVVPVYDFGWLPDGRTFYTMREVRGDHLADVIAHLHKSSRAGPWNEEGPWTFRRVVGFFRHACEAVAYAHARGVIHRDLKPENILVGEFNEVYVVDWGLARLLGNTASERPVEVDPEDVGGDAALRGETRVGASVGTPGFMSPEQKRGIPAEIGAPTDVFALGVVLFQLLTNRRCDPEDPARTRKVQARILARPEHARRVPAALRKICLKATSPEPADRYPDAHQIAVDLERWIEGAERREQALALVRKADALRPRIARMRHKKRELTEMAAQWLDRVPPERPVAEKRRAWAMQDEAHETSAEIERTEVEYVELLTSALQQVPLLPEARTRLARFYRTAHGRAEEVADFGTATRMEARLRAVDDGTHAPWLKGDGLLTVLTDPPGARCRLLRYEARDRRLVAVPAGDLGPSPVIERPIEMGRYLVVIEHPERETVRYPVWIPRGHTWSLTPPGADSPRPILLPRRGSLGRDDVYVPSGWFRTGMPERARSALAPAWVWVDSFVVRRFPVTNQDYIAFLEDLVQLGHEREALHYAPREQGVHGVEGALLLRRRIDGGFRVGGSSYLADPLAPVVMVPHDAAVAYAQWMARRVNLPWRLPGELEWEKAARGTDARRYPWGDHFDPTWANCRDTRPDHPSLALVDTFPVDESPYGVRGMGGNVRDWCADVFHREGPLTPDGQATIRVSTDGQALRVDRGGCWAEVGTEGAATSRREATPTDGRAPWIGFRLARSYPDH